MDIYSDPVIYWKQLLLLSFLPHFTNVKLRPREVKWHSKQNWAVSHTQQSPVPSLGLPTLRSRSFPWVPLPVAATGTAVQYQRAVYGISWEGRVYTTIRLAFQGTTLHLAPRGQRLPARWAQSCGCAAGYPGLGPCLGKHLAREVLPSCSCYLESPWDLDKNLDHEALVSSFSKKSSFYLAPMLLTATAAITIIVNLY